MMVEIKRENVLNNMSSKFNCHLLMHLCAGITFEILNC